MTPKLVTWLGEDDKYFTISENEAGEQEKNPAPGPSFMFLSKVRFDKDKPVLIDPEQAPSPDFKKAYEHILKKAPLMTTTFKVEDVPEDDDDDDDEAKEAKEARKPKHQAVPKRKK